MKGGFTMRQQVVAAIHAKVLRLNSAAVGHANMGRIINLARCVIRLWWWRFEVTKSDRKCEGKRLILA